ncbi:class I adenylate-forming enzyme family protein [Streptomyces sp. NPDC058985]|uniref:class I adenylate-forming enzyme family protein n=1 Tax=Streptomyces sp. NPDC058985 TaxID=3346684 RepID=UPI0036CB1DB9
MTVALHDLLPATLRRTWAVEGTCPDLDLYSLYRARQIADPHRTAVLDAKGKLCYTALDRRARCLAAGLSGLGIRAGDVVGVQIPNGRDAVVADLALAALGAVALPFPVGRGGREAASLLRRSEAVAVIAAAEHRGSRHAADLLALTEELPALRAVVAAGPAGTAPEGAVPLSALMRTDPKTFTPARPDPDTAARILVSSGSESEPKMVAYSHNALAGGRGNFLGSLIPDGRPPRCLFLVPLASAFGSNGTPVALARHGGTLILLDHFTPDAALEAIAEHEPTHVLGVPTMIRMMLDRIAEGGHRTFAPPTAVVVGGSPLDEATAAEARLAFGCPVVNLYGSADGVNCHTGLASGSPDGDGRPGIAAGQPDPRVADIRIAVPGTRELREVSGGTVGEIVARGPMTPLCYVAAPDLDARYRTEDGWVRTGDLGLIDDDGTLRVVGRLKDVVIRGGANISPAEVEVELATHPAVRDVVCVGVPDPLMGERLAACVVPRDGAAAPTLEELCAHLDTRAVERRKHPERLLVLSGLPLTPAGKPDRAAMRERCASASERRHPLAPAG